MTDATPLASEQITQDADLLTRAKVRIAIGKQTGAHTGNRLNIYQIAEELLTALSATPAPSDQDASQAQGEGCHCVGLGLPNAKCADCNGSGVKHEIEQSWTGDPHALAAELRRVANGWQPGFRLPQLLRDAADEIDCLMTQIPAPGATAQDGVETIPLYTVDEAWDELLNKDDRTSPEDYPDMCLIEKAELQAFMEARQWPPATPTPTIPAGMVAVPRDDETRPFADSLLPEAMIEAGADALEKARDDGRNYVSGETIDWDDGMIAVAIYRAMLAAAPKQAEQQGVEALRAEAVKAEDAMREMFRYFDGGETRGSYDGRPERDGLRRAWYSLRAALNAPTGAVEKERGA